MNNNINSFSFFRDYYNVIKELNKKDQSAVLMATMQYVFEDIEPELEGLSKGVWNLLKRPLDVSKIKSNSGQKTNQSDVQKQIKGKSKVNQNKIKRHIKRGITAPIS